MISLSEHTFLGTLDHKNVCSCFVISVFEKFKLLVSIYFISLNFKFGFPSWNLKNNAFLRNSFKLIILFCWLSIE